MAQQNKKTHRSTLKVIVDILEVLSSSGIEVNQLTLVRNANLDWDNAKSKCDMLLAANMIEKSKSGRGLYYKITPNGNQFLEVYYRFEKFCKEAQLDSIM